MAGVSSSDGKIWIEQALKALVATRAWMNPPRILDVGAGCGTYSWRYRHLFPDTKWTAIEIWQPYIEKYDLESKYNNVIQEDARTALKKFSDLGARFRIIFMGDVLEHMAEVEAAQLVALARGMAEYVFISIPVIHYPQGEVGGNKYEIHVEEDWNAERVFAKFGIPSDYFEEGCIGVFVYTSTPPVLAFTNEVKLLPPEERVQIVPDEPLPADAGTTKDRPFIAVYGICKNEEKFVDRFMESLVGEADGIFITDTGSTDGTLAALAKWEKVFGVQVFTNIVEPWRFDLARNISLNHVPHEFDICFCLDMDEVVTKGWAAKIQAGWKANTTRMRYPFIWNHNDDGSDGITYWADKIHARRAYKWRHPVHETLELLPGVLEQTVWEWGIRIDHWADNSKPRSSYLPLLALAVVEAPENDRLAHYYAREMMFAGQHREAIAEFQRHLTLPSARWDAERSASMRFIGRCYEAVRGVGQAEAWYMRAHAEAPTEREPLVALMWLYYRAGRWMDLAWAGETALKIVSRPASYICEPAAWGSDVPDLTSIGWYRLGDKARALSWAKVALALSPNDPRIVSNIAEFSS